MPGSAFPPLFSDEQTNARKLGRSLKVKRQGCYWAWFELKIPIANFKASLVCRLVTETRIYRSPKGPSWWASLPRLQWRHYKLSHPCFLIFPDAGWYRVRIVSRRSSRIGHLFSADHAVDSWLAHIILPPLSSMSFNQWCTPTEGNISKQRLVGGSESLGACFSRMCLVPHSSSAAMKWTSSPWSSMSLHAQSGNQGLKSEALSQWNISSLKFISGFLS